MATLKLDTVGLKCPLPILRIATMMPKVKSGDVLEITGDCETFDRDIRKWCSQMGRVMTSMVRKDNLYIATIQF
jgi:tRNA 2-thiouridine synthesizing protein A